MKKHLIITTIAPMNEVMRQFAAMPEWRLVLVGDRKGPERMDDSRVTFLGFPDQGSLGFELYGHCPENHYSRKNLGYLYAISQGAEIIAETDDDNFPRQGWGEDVRFSLEAADTVERRRYFNVYRLFCPDHVWPRGFPLDRVLDGEEPVISKQEASIGTWQGLADLQPDVDAIYRLTVNKTVSFHSREPVVLAPHVYCPFNSQNTFWIPKAFPFMYLPMTVSMRFTDILRGYVAQRLLWQAGLRLAFGEASVYQERNLHNLMRDFNDEVPMYQQVDRTVDTLESVSLSGGPLDWLVQAYGALAESSVVQPAEVKAASAWAADLRRHGYR